MLTITELIAVISRIIASFSLGLTIGRTTILSISRFLIYSGKYR